MLILNHVGASYFGYFNGDVGHVRKLLEINFLSYVAMATAALPMLKESGGSIVVVSSMAGEWGAREGTWVDFQKQAACRDILKEPELLNALKKPQPKCSFCIFSTEFVL